MKCQIASFAAAIAASVVFGAGAPAAADVPALKGQVLEVIDVDSYTYLRLKTEFVYLIVILDGFSRKVVGWELDRTLVARLTIAALEQAIEKRGPEPGLVHHSDRGFQYACAEYIAILETYHMVSSMSRPANPYYNASCESSSKR